MEEEKENTEGGHRRTRNIIGGGPSFSKVHSFQSSVAETECTSKRPPSIYPSPHHKTASSPSIQHTSDTSDPSAHQPPLRTTTMSFLGFGGARPQPSSEQKIAAAEAEIEMVSNMFTQYAAPSPSMPSNTRLTPRCTTDSSTRARASASSRRTARRSSARARRCVWTGAWPSSSTSTSR